MIHKTAIISETSKLADNVEIGAYSIIGPNVKIESNTKIHSHVNIVGNTSIGIGNEIFPFSSTNPILKLVPPNSIANLIYYFTWLILEFTNS